MLRDNVIEIPPYSLSQMNGYAYDVHGDARDSSVTAETMAPTPTELEIKYQRAIDTLSALGFTDLVIATETPSFEAVERAFETVAPWVEDGLKAGGGDYDVIIAPNVRDYGLVLGSGNLVSRFNWGSSERWSKILAWSKVWTPDNNRNPVHDRNAQRPFTTALLINDVPVLESMKSDREISKENEELVIPGLAYRAKDFAEQVTLLAEEQSEHLEEGRVLQPITVVEWLTANAMRRMTGQQVLDNNSTTRFIQYPSITVKNAKGFLGSVSYLPAATMGVGLVGASLNTPKQNDHGVRRVIELHPQQYL